MQPAWPPAAPAPRVTAASILCPPPAGQARRRRLIHGALIIGGLLAAAAWWFEDSLPAPARLHPQVLTEPLQVPIEAAQFKTAVEGHEYLIRPRYGYDISGLVVSRHDADTWWDTAHREAEDRLNPVDLCLVWGRDASLGVYRDVRFSSGQWTCYAEWRTRAAGNAFDPTQFSNNHMVTDRSDLRRALRGLRVGDQVRLRGYLVDYGLLRDGQVTFLRVSSDTRLDTGPGACEIVFVTSVEALRSSGAVWQFAWYLGLALLAGGGVAWLRLPVARLDESDFA